MSAIGAAVAAGLSNFFFKQAAVRKYNAELFSLYGAVVSFCVLATIVIFRYDWSMAFGLVGGLVFIGGFIASLTNIFKVYALRFIDSTIYFPLYKLIAPALSICVGVVFFGEAFSRVEWFGMLLGLLVPLLLITKIENGRQTYLLAGLGLVLLTGMFSAASASFMKLGSDVMIPTLVVMTLMSFGLSVGTLSVIVLKKGIGRLFVVLMLETSKGLVMGSLWRAGLIGVSMLFTLHAYISGGTLAIVQTIHSMYILIPIVLAIVIYNEHWNLQKVIAIVLSISSLAFLGGLS